MKVIVNEKEIEVLALEDGTYVLKDPELKGWLEDRDRVITEGRELQKEIRDLNDKAYKQSLELNRIKERVIPRVMLITKDIELGEFEMWKLVELVDGEPTLQIEDLLIGFREQVEGFKTKEEDYAQTIIGGEEADPAGDEAEAGEGAKGEDKEATEVEVATSV